MSDAATILHDYLIDLRRISKTGQAVPETSYYGAMETLFNTVGQGLEQPVFCVLNPRNRGAGIPDGGLFLDTASEEVRVDRPGFGRQPERGVIEAKPTSQDIDALARSEQVRKYLAQYGQVLATNFYQFVLVTRAADGSARDIGQSTVSLSSNQTTAQATNTVAAGTLGTATAPTCAAGYTPVATNCESSSPQMPFVFASGGVCSARNNGAASADLRASVNCCRTAF